MKIYGPRWSHGFNPDLGFGFIILRKGRLRDKSGMLCSCHRIFSIPKSTLSITCKRFKIFIDLPKNICTLPDTSSHSHIWMTSFCSNDRSSIQSKLKWESQTVHGVTSGQLRIKQPFDSNFHIKHVNRGSVPSVILNLGSEAQKRPGRARLCHNSKESWDTHRADTETPQCSLAKGWPLAPRLKPRNRPTLTVGSQRPPQLHRHAVQCLGTIHTQGTTISCGPHSWGRVQRQDPAQTRPLVVGIPHHPEKKYSPLAIRSGPRLAHYPLSLYTQTL